MANKSTKNPLLTGAGISFPFENFTNSALLVPVAQNEPPLIPEEIEADNFLGQEPQSSFTNFKSFAGSTASAPGNKSYPTQSLAKGYCGPSSTPDFRTHFPSNSQQLGGLPNQSPIPVFTQSFTGILNPTKPTPVYGDALTHQSSQTLNNLPFQPTSDDDLLQPTTIIKPLTQTVQSVSTQASSVFSNQIPSHFAPPPVFTPALTPAPLTVFPPVSTPAATVIFSAASTLITPTIFTPASTSTSSAVLTTTSSPTNSAVVSSASPVTANPSPSSQSVYSSTPEIPSAASSQTLFNYFSGPEQTQQSSSPFTTPVPLPLQHPPESNVPPPSGGQQNSYRLSNIKRPTYTRPPELPVTPMATMPSPMTPTQTSAALFTPCSVDSLGSEGGVSTTISAPTVSYKFPNQTTTSASPPVILPPSFASLAQGACYRPVYHHWFFKRLVEGKVLWQPFTMSDSLALEQAFTSATISAESKVATDGGRYDVEVLRRRRTAVYWQEEPGEVRRCSWFVKGSMDIRYVPYEENVATMLEEEYRIASSTNEWNRHVPLPDGEVIVIHSPNAIAHHTRSVSPDVWGNSAQMQQKPRVVKRGMDEFDISDGEPEKVDHLLFLVHGIGKFCDLKFRPVTEVVDDFRSVSLQLLQSHFKEAVEAGQASRVEVLPVSWHQALHSEHIDTRLNNITLQSIPRLRHFTNDTLLDILFYTSPVFCETIVQAVGNELNRLYNLFLSRNPTFQGGVSLGGHSLGSLILFDMLCHQSPVASPLPNTNSTSTTPTPDGQDISGAEEVQTLGCMKTTKARLSRTVSYVSMGTAGTGQPYISYPQLVFRPKALFALGSPIGMFITVRGIETLGEDFSLPTCPMFFNIFHPFDPVAYRVESLINSDFSKYSPVLIPHHKGRKRMHLELKDTLEHVGTALKQRLMESVKTTWNTVYQLAMFHRTDDHTIEQEVNKVIENELMQSHPNEPTMNQTPDNNPGPDVKMGQLNGGRRIDYVLQEAPLESFNEYLFALSSHVCYWESEDTMLMMLKEIYSSMNISPDTQVVQQILPFEMPDGGEPMGPQYVPLPPVLGSGGMDPTAPLSDTLHIGPPPRAGFVRK